MKSVREYFSDKSGEQIFVLCLLVSSVAVMLLCVIARLCGILWFAADLEIVPVPNKFWQEVITAALMVFELIFVYKILCRTKWIICFCIAVIETLIGILIGYLTNGNDIATNIFYLACILFIPIIFVREWYSILENILLYAISMLYGVIFLVGRIGGVDENAAYNFVIGVLGTIDYKLFIVSLYLVIKYFGGIRLWKKQKRLIFQTDLRK